VDGELPVTQRTPAADPSIEDSPVRSVGVDPDRLAGRLAALAELGRDPAGGWTRPAYSADEARARLLVAGWLTEAGAAVRVDAAGNLLGRTGAAEPDGPVTLVGSHVDTVRHGGRWDGALGVVAAVEAVTVLAQAGVRLEWPVEVVAFAATEPQRFGPAARRYGSRALAGQVGPPAGGAHPDADGIALAAAMSAAGLVPWRLGEAARDPRWLHCMLELHVDDGTALAGAGVPVGVATSLDTGRGAVPTDRRVRELIRAGAADAGVPVRAVAAGGGHDAVTFAPWLPTGLLLVRNVSGQVHAPGEHVDPADAVAGAAVLAATLLRLAGAPPRPEAV
jgi:acetylornithine deacetylase/succinyl-diaminopimelate desuccinylase-like protein